MRQALASARARGASSFTGRRDRAPFRAGIIFEARPDAAVQIASLALKSANAIILKGGREAAHSNRVIVDCFRDALAAQGIDANAVQLVSTREEVQALLALDEYIDVRGKGPGGAARAESTAMTAARPP